MSEWFKRILTRLLNPRSGVSKLQPATAVGERDAAADSALAQPRGRLRGRDVILNLPLVVGGIIVLGLFLLVLFGPIWAPTNPYVSAQHLVPHYNVKQGEYISTPLPPSSDHLLGTDRWGNDLLSMLMHGARNTLVACAFITMARVILGVILGGVAGWNEGKPVDQIVMGLVGVTTSVPMLISSMLLIYVLDIRRGLPVFIVALSLIGWTEIAQYIRSEFLVLRKMSYIEGARAVGLNELAVAVRHVLPNVLPQLLVITFLEMGAVMMLLGELGFIGVYIGGGSRIRREIDPRTFEMVTLVEVPEWGAMLADGFRWLRSKPFVVFPSAIAFFISVLGFNALGEGLRQLIEKSSISTAFLLRKRMLLGIVLLVLATVFIINNTGAAPWFAKVAGAFDGERAYAHVEALAAMDGRGVGQEGSKQAASYIVQKFQEYGLEPAWARSTYTYPLSVQLVRPVAQPQLALLDGEGQVVQSFRHQLDFGFMTEGHGGGGDVQSPLTFVGFVGSMPANRWEAFKGLDLRGRIVLLLQGNAPSDFVEEALIRGAHGVLWITAYEQKDVQRDDVRSQMRLVEGNSLRRPTLPVFRIRPQVVDALLQAEGITLDDLLVKPEEGQSGQGWFTRDLDTAVHMSLQLGEPQALQVPCVLGYKAGSDYDLSGELVVLFAHYDGLGVDPDGTVFPAVNSNASGVGVLLEVARLWQDQNLDARRSVLFVAWGGGQLEGSDAASFLLTKSNLRHLPALRPNEPAMIVQLDGLGRGQDALFVHPKSNKRLLTLFQDTAAEVGLDIDTELETDDFDIVTRRIPWIYFSWSKTGFPPDQDDLAGIDANKLESVGEMLVLTLTQVVRQSRY